MLEINTYLNNSIKEYIYLTIDISQIFILVLNYKFSLKQLSLLFWKFYIYILIE